MKKFLCPKAYNRASMRLCVVSRAYENFSHFFMILYNCLQLNFPNLLINWMRHIQFFFLSFDDFYKTCIYLNNKGISFHFLYPIKKLLQVQTFFSFFRRRWFNIFVFTCIKFFLMFLFIYLLVAVASKNL